MRKAEFTRTFCADFNRQQIEAICAQDARVLLLAVPGSGKTSVMTARAAYQILCLNADPAQMLTVTFSRAATRDMGERFAARFGAHCAGAPLFCTINSLANRIIEECCRVYGLVKPVLLEHRHEVLREAYARCFADEGYPSGAMEGALDSAVSYCKNMLFTRAERLRYCPDEELTPRVFNAVFEAMVGIMRERNLIDFDDQSMVALMLLEMYPELLKALRARYRYISVDEAQDTSYAQHRLIHLLSSEAESLFMVGDEDQSIYGFRGAYPDVLLAFERVYQGGITLRMESNYRSSKNIVRAAERFIHSGTQRIQKRMTTPNPAGPQIVWRRFLHMRKQYPYIAQRLMRCANEGKSVAVMYRNNVSAVALADFLLQSGVPFCCTGGVRAALSGEKVQNVLSVLRFLCSPQDGELFFAACNALRLAVTAAQCQSAVERTRDRAKLPFEALAQILTSADVYAQAKALSERVEALSRMNPVRVLTTAWALCMRGEEGQLAYGPTDIEKLDMLCCIASRCTDITAFIERIDALRALKTGAWGGENSDPPEEFAVCGVNKYDSTAPTALLCTIHASKGLEFDTVILIDANKGVFPPLTHRKGTAQDPLGAERRLFYVAVTRARNELELLSARRGYCGRLAPSAFIREFVGKGRIRRAILGLAVRATKKDTQAYNVALAQVQTCRPWEDEFSHQPKATWHTGGAYACYDVWQELPEVNAGGEVWHEKLGKGCILRREDKLAEIDFGGRLRKLNIEYCLDEGILHLSAQDKDGFAAMLMKDHALQGREKVI